MGHSLLDRRASLERRTFLVMFRILLIFGMPAVIGFFAGRYLDTTYDMRPYGSLLVLGITLIFSWVLVIRLYLSLEKERREIEKLEQEQDIETSLSHE